jgi:signal peptidase II
MGSRWPAFALAFVVFALDRITKVWIQQQVGTFDTHVIIPNVLNIVHSENPGAAFGMLADGGGAWRSVLLVGISLAVMFYIALLLWRPERSGFGPGRTLPVALAFVLGGAIGNLYDRIVRGTVTDFVQVFIGPYEWPAFNVADSAITVGAALLLLNLWRSRNTRVRDACSPS